MPKLIFKYESTSNYDFSYPMSFWPNVCPGLFQ